MAYVQESDLLGDISQEFLTQGLQDAQDGSQVPVTFAQLAASVAIDINAYVGMRYALPLVPNTPLYPDTYGYPPVIASAAKLFALEKVYKRRGVADDKNPWAAQAGQMRTLLKAISLGNSPLAPELNRKDPTASVVTQPMRTVGGGPRQQRVTIMLPLRIDEILAKLNDAVCAWAKQNNAITSIARDPFNVLEILAESPAGCRVILHWAGDHNPSDILQAAISRNDIEVILSYNLGLTLKPDLALIRGTTTRPPLFQLLDDLRALVLSLAYPDEETLVYCVYVGTEPFITPEGVPLAAYRMRFQLDSAVNTQPRQIPV